MDSFLIRDCEMTDVPCVTAIYSVEVLSGLVSFEEIPPDQIEMAKRLKMATSSGLPFLVASLNQRVVGYAYASTYRPRPAYRHTVESSVYVGETGRGKGVGFALLTELTNRLSRTNCRQIIAVIGDSANQASIRLHKKSGFRHVGVLFSVGFKHGHWVDTVMMQKPIEFNGIDRVSSEQDP